MTAQSEINRVFVNFRPLAKSKYIFWDPLWLDFGKYQMQNAFVTS